MRLLSTSGHRVLLQLHYHSVRLPYSTKALANGFKPRDVEHGVQHNVQLPSARAATGDQQRCSFILPPPNVTGDLHLGHALMCTIQDVIARHRRRCGDDVCWIPGTDHAGIATQVVVEKSLRAQYPSLSRQQLGRDRFLAEVWRWRNSKATRIRADLQRLGATADWQREYFTMDAQQSRAVRAAFVRLFDDGLLYRDGRLVNWSCALESTISDIEVDVVSVQGRTRLAVPGYEKPVVFGEMTKLAYAVCDGTDSANTQLEVVVATTRPETVLGDVAVAVHPDDPRYAHLRDATRPTFLWHSLRSERIPLLFDDAVDPEFGTGAVKITPAHDRFDYELARRHQLPTTVSVIDERGTIAPGFGELSGLPRFVARDRIREMLAELQLLRGVREHTMQLPVCSRSRDVVELLVRPQWFVRCAEMSAEAQRAVREGELRLEPSHFEADWDRWLAEARDWCVSRQLWWGHRVPAFECDLPGGQSVWVAADDEQEARRKAAKVLAVADVTAIRVQQDPDVLDTWFSAALLPFSALGWPDTSAAAAPDYQRYYPHNLLVTGHDILFFWVARMVMLGQRLTGRVPFDHVLLHGIVCDAQGRKMSKSLGNVVSPEQVIEGRSLQQLQAQTDEAREAGVLGADECERSKRDQAKMFPAGIAECGTDALRFTLCGHNVRSHFVAFDVGECYTNKLFFNKIWQATRFTVSACDRWPVARGGRTGAVEELEEDGRLRLTTMDRWILSRLARTRQSVRAAIDAYQFHVATAALKTFFYQNLCDVYVETTKTGVAETAVDRRRAIAHCAVLSACLRRGLAELAPFAPFLSAKLLQHVSERRSASVFAGDEDEESGAQWLDEQLEQDVEEMLAICAAIRQLKSERNITRKHEAEVHMHITDPELRRRLQQSHTDDMRVLSLSKAVRFSDRPLNQRSPSEAAVMVAQSTAGAHCTFGLEVSAAVAEELQLGASSNTGSTVNGRKLQKLEQDLHKLESTVANEGFQRAASAKVQQQHKEKIERIRSELASIRQMG